MEAGDKNRVQGVKGSRGSRLIISCQVLIEIQSEVAVISNINVLLEVLTLLGCNTVIILSKLKYFLNSSHPQH